MRAVTLYLTVYPEGTTTAGGGGTQWNLVMKTPFLPRIGDTVEGLYDTAHAVWFGDLKVSHLYWEGDGTVHVILRALQNVRDPRKDDHVGMNYGRMKAIEQLVDGVHRAAWWFEQDGDLDALLRASGWRMD